MDISERIQSRLEQIPEFVSALMEKIKNLPISQEDFFYIKLSLSEALVNAVRHGNRLNSDLPVNVRIHPQKDRITIKIEDQGSGFNPKDINDPTSPENLEKPSGRGIFLIRSFMDEVDFFDHGRGIKMVKFFKKEASGEDKTRKKK